MGDFQNSTVNGTEMTYDELVRQLSYFITNEVRMPAGLTVTVINHIEAQQAEIERLRALNESLQRQLLTAVIK